MQEKYNHQEVDKKWQEKWKEANLYKTDLKDSSKEKYFFGDTLNGYICEFTGVDFPADINADIDEARNTTIAYASYRFIQNRYSTSPDYAQTFNLIIYKREKNKQQLNTNKSHQNINNQWCFTLSKYSHSNA